jgi:hypothetical protein
MLLALGGVDLRLLVQGMFRRPNQDVYLRKAAEIAANFCAEGAKHGPVRWAWANQTMGLLLRSCDLFMPRKDDLRWHQLGICDLESFMVA